jgi:Ca-activated chloride channel family protein
MTGGLATTLARHLVHPEGLAAVCVGLALAAALVAASWAQARRRARRLLGSARIVGAARLARDGALVAALAAISAAGLGLRIGTRVHLVPSSGADVVLLLDVSRSMDAADVPPSRLTRARAVAADLLGRLAPGDRAALAAFAGRGVLLTPLTPDTEALADLLEGIDTGILGVPGSDLDAGASAALGAFEAGSERPRVVVALTDGEDPAGGSDDGAESLRRAGVRLIAVALGTDTGGTVPEDGAPLRDRDGHVVVSKRDPARLGRWAAATGGRLFVADRWGDVDPGALVAAVRRDAGRAPGAWVARREPALQTTPLAALAFALLWLEVVGGPHRFLAAARRRLGRRPRTVAWRARAASLVAGALLALAATPAPEDTPSSELPDPTSVPALEAALRARPADPRLLLLLGVAQARGGDASEARHAFRSAALGAGDPHLAALAWYDLGVLALSARELPTARDAFFEALALEPDDARARFDLEWTLRALRAAPPPPATAPGAREPAEGAAPKPRGPRTREARPALKPAAPLPKAEPGAAAAGKRFAAELAPADVARWLAAVGDRSGMALRAASRSSEAHPRRRSAAAAW